jgi:uncharacterized repeat protein (TIGR01451 family)
MLCFLLAGSSISFAQAPGGVTGAKLWLKADRGVTTQSGNGSLVTNWSDSSGSANHANDNDFNGNSTPTYFSAATLSLVNFNPTVEFQAGTEDRMYGGDLGMKDDTTWSYFMLSRSKETSSDSSEVFSFSNRIYGNIQFHNDKGGHMRSANTAGGITPTDMVTNHQDKSTVVSFIGNGSSTGYLNGFAGTTAGTGRIDYNTDTRYLIGDFNGAAKDCYGMLLTDLIVYNRNLTNLERERVETYLAIKGGVTLSHDYLLSDGTEVWSLGSGYDNDITGVARDDSQGLYQKQSKSTNGDDPITMGVATIAISNSANTASITTDKSALIWGNNNATGTKVIAECTAVFGDANARLNRIWRTSETGTVGNMRVSAAILGAFRASSPVYMLVSSSPTFTSYTTVPTAISSGQIVANYDFSGVQYFTFQGSTTGGTCVPCEGGAQTMAWKQIGWTRGANSKLAIPLSGMTADVEILDPSGVEYLPTKWPRRYGNMLRIVRNDSNNTAAMTYRMKFTKASLPSFIIHDVDKRGGAADEVTVEGYCGTTLVTPKLTHVLKASRSSYNISENVATGWRAGSYLRRGQVQVVFDKAVDRVEVIHKVTHTYARPRLQDIYIGNVQLSCPQPTSCPNADNVYLTKSFAQDSYQTCDKLTYLFEVRNLDCQPKVINFTDVLPSGMKWEIDSLGDGELANGIVNNYGDTNTLSINSLTVPGGTTRFTATAYFTGGPGTYSNQAQLTVQGGSGAAILSDDVSGIFGCQSTAVTVTSGAAPIIPLITKFVDKTQYTPAASGVGELLTYTIEFNNTSGAAITGIEFSDSLDEDATYVSGSLSSTLGGTANTYGDTGILEIENMNIPSGITTISFQARANQSAGILYNTGRITLDPEAPCAAAVLNSGLSNTVVTTFVSQNPTDTDGDGTPDDIDLDKDNDGILDAEEGTADTDGDGIPNILDLDSDGDGCFDALEGGSAFTPVNIDSNGRLVGSISASGVPTVAGVGQSIGISQNSSIQDASCLVCNLATAPVLGTNSLTNTCPTPTVSLSSITSANAPSGAILSWHTATPATAANAVSTPGAVGAGNYYATFYNSANGCYLNNGASTTAVTVTIIGCTDTDGDTVPDNVDLDDDGDGIPDATEGTGDADGDTVPDSLDRDADGDGVSDSVELTTALNGGDTDGDTIPDYKDLDSDNDGINDVREAGGADTNGDGKQDGADVDNDGVADTVDTIGGSVTNGTALPDTDTDGDGKPNRVDLDSDNDSVPDLWDNGNKTADSNGDGFLSPLDNGVNDSDGDGIMSPVDGAPTVKGDASDPVPTNTDGTGGPNYLDPDSDGDGISDLVEAGRDPGLLDPDGDGVIESPQSSDADGDGLADPVDTNDTGFGGATPTTTPTDTDGDTVPDNVDLDDDGDGIPDANEGTGDTDGDTVPDSLDRDADGDGVLDSVEFTTAINNGDTDGDTIPDYKDLDSDNDSINDVREAGGTDNNGDGRQDGADVDHDGVADSVDTFGGSVTNGTALPDTDTDGDGRPNRVDLDSDNDSVPDLWENGNKANDSNNDGFLSPQEGGNDADGDGIMSSVDGAPAVKGDASDPQPADTDSTGGPNYLDPDSDGDNISDLVEAGRDPGVIDPDGDGVIESPQNADADGDGLADVVDINNSAFGGATPTTTPSDTDGDTVPDNVDLDDDGDGIPDSVEISNAINGGDTDGDTIPDYRDLDSDGDGIYDNDEAGHAGADVNSDGKVDGPFGADGIPDSIQESPNAGTVNYTVRDTDGDGRPNYLDLDSDNDTIGDLLESGNGGLIDMNHDGKADGMPNANGTVPGAGAQPIDSDTDGTADYIDADSDNDGVKDIVDNGFSPLDANGDGKIDSVVDGDADGIPDGIDTDLGNFGGVPAVGCEAWNQANPPDIDGDVFPADQEYAFGGNPQRGDHLVSGTSRAAGLQIAKNASGGIMASFVRPRGRYDVIYTLEGSSDLNAWSVIASAPTVTSNGDGTDTLSWANIRTLAPLTPSQGYIRMKVATPCLPTGSYTLVKGYRISSQEGSRQTYGVNFTSAPVYTGVIDAASGTNLVSSSAGNGQNLAAFLSAGSSYYVEITDGAAEGHRIDISGGAEDTFALNLLSVNNTTKSMPSGLNGSHFVVRKHITLSDIFVNAEWDGGISVGSSDQILFWNGSAYDTYWKFDGTGNWVRTAITSQNAKIIPPGVGVFANHKTPNDINTVIQLGEVRYNDFIRPLVLGSTGLNIVANGYPLDASPSSQGMTIANNFVSSVSSGSATQILSWNGDTKANNAGYSTRYLHSTGSWRSSFGFVDVTNNALFKAGRATFVDMPADKADWKITQPWNAAPWVQPIGNR